MKTALRSLSLVSASLIASACGSASRTPPPVTQPPAAPAAAPQDASPSSADAELPAEDDASDLAAVDGTGGDADEPADDEKPQSGKPLFEGRYAISVTVAGISLCAGEFGATVTLPTLMDMSFLNSVTGQVDCGIAGKMDMSTIMSMLGVGAKPNPEGAGLAGDDSDASYVLSTPELAGIKFDPPRPLMIHYLKLIDEQADARVAKVNHTVNLTAKGPSGDATGTCRVTTLSAGQAYKVQRTGKSYDRSVVFENVCQGFKQIDMLTYLLIPRFQVDVAFTDEAVAIAHVEAQATVRDVKFLLGNLNTGVLGGAISLIGGLLKVAISIDLVDGGEIVLADLVGAL